MSDLATGLAATTNTPAESTPAPAPSTTPASSPVSLSDHFTVAGVSEAPAPPSPDVQTGDVPTTAAPPTETPQPEAVTGKEGPIPFQAHKTALENARTKAAAETEQRLTQQWQAEIEPIKAHLPIANAIAQDVASGSIEGIAHLITEYAQHPQLGPQIRSMFGRMLGQRSQQQAQQQQAQVETEPEADLQTAEGELVYSAKQLKAWQQWNAKQQEKTLSEKFAPVQEIAAQVKQARETQAQTQQYVSQSQPLLAELRALPGFSDHTAEIAAKQSELFKQAYEKGEKADVVSLWLRAYREVVPNKLQQQQQTQLVQSAMAKASGRTDNPASVAASPPPPPKDLATAFKQFGVTG